MNGLRSTSLAFGKIPAHGDFVRAGARSPTVEVFDQWLQEGVAELKTRGDGAADPNAAPEPVNLVYTSAQAREVLVGSLVMSRDRVGRRYPLLVARAVDRALLDPREVPFWPIVWHDLLAATAALASEAVTSLDAENLAIRLESLPPLADPRDPRLVRDHSELLRTTTSGVFWEALWGDTDSAQKYAVLLRLLEVVRPARGGPGEHGLAFPLAINGSPISAEAVWLEAVWRLWPRRAELPVLAWPAGAAPGRLLVFPGGAPRRSAPAMLGGAVSPRLLVELDAPMARPTDAVLALPARYGRLLEHAELPLASLLNGL